MLKALILQLGMSITNYDHDYPEDRFTIQKQIKLLENIFQICLILMEILIVKQTITVLQLFNVVFGYFMVTVTFAQDAGSEFAAKYLYSHLRSIQGNCPDSQLGGTERDIKDGIIDAIKKNTTPEKYRQQIRKGNLHEQVNQICPDGIDDAQFRRLFIDQTPFTKL